MIISDSENMTAETLKPFITPTSSNFPNAEATSGKENPQRAHKIGIILGLVGILLTTVLLAFTIWFSIRLVQLESEVVTLRQLEPKLQSLNKLVETMRNRLSLHHLEEPNEGTEVIPNIMEQNPDTFDDTYGKSEEDSDIDDDDDLDYDDKDYEDIIKQYAGYQDNKDDGDSFYEDFEKFQSSKSKGRKSRSLIEKRLRNAEEIKDEDKSEASNELSSKFHQAQELRHGLSLESNNDRPQFISEKRHNRREYALLLKSQRRHKSKKLKLGELARSPRDISYTPAAHFHLHARSGGIYIGKPSWSNFLSTQYFFTLENGVLRVHDPGLYYVYAQICYVNAYDQNGFTILHENRSFLQCLSTVPSNGVHKFNSCHTSGLIYLQANETIHLQDIHIEKDAWLKELNSRSFFGIFKV